MADDLAEVGARSQAGLGQKHPIPKLIIDFVEQIRSDHHVPKTARTVALRMSFFLAQQ